MTASVEDGLACYEHHHITALPASSAQPPAGTSPVIFGGRTTGALTRDTASAPVAVLRTGPPRGRRGGGAASADDGWEPVHPLTPPA